MALDPKIREVVDVFLDEGDFFDSGGVITDIDGTAVHEVDGRIYIPEPVEFGLKAIYDCGRPVVLNSLRFPLSVMRTFGKEWLAISGSPIPVISMNGSQMGYVVSDENGYLCFDEMIAFPLSTNEINAVLAGVDALLADDIRDLLLFYYPRDWRMGEIIWTPIAARIDHVKNKYTSASAVTAVEAARLEEDLHRDEVCMIFLLIERPADDLMAYQHSRPSSFFTAKGVDKLSGTRVMAERLGFQLNQSVGAGDTAMDNFLSGVGLSVHVGRDLEFRGTRSTVRVADSLQLGDLLFRLARARAETAL